jgi:hypothetical protein
VSRRALTCAALLFVSLGCSAEDVVTPLPASELRAAPSVIVVGGQSLALVPYLWRDFQPVSPPNGKPLAAVLRVTAADRKPLTASFVVDAAWISNGDEVWTARVEDEGHSRADPLYYEVVARDGPKWDPGIRVDVVVRVREQSGATKLLRAADQLIGRTD